MSRRLPCFAYPWCALACLSCAAPADGTQLGSLSQAVIHGGVSWVSALDPDDPLQRSANLEVGLLRAAAFFRDGDDWLRRDVSPIGEQQLLCPDQPLASEVSLAVCSGVAVAADVVVTAAHCLEDTPCTALLVTSAFDLPLMQSFRTAEVVGCSRVLALDGAEVVAVIQLAQQLPGDFACSLRSSRGGAGTGGRGVIASSFALPVFGISIGAGSAATRAPRAQACRPRSACHRRRHRQQGRRHHQRRLVDHHPHSGCRRRSGCQRRRPGCRHRRRPS